MSKDAFFFKHDLYARNDPKMVNLRRDLGMAGYGVLWAIVEMLHENGGRIKNDADLIAWELRADPALIEKVLCCGAFSVDDGFISSERVDRDRLERARAQESGREFALKRWDRMGTGRTQNGPPIAPPNGDPLATHRLPNARRGEERIEEEKVGAAPKSARAAHPSLEDVQEYCASRGNIVDPIKWFNHYTANGWRVGRNPMKDWRAAVITWERSEDQMRVRDNQEQVAKASAAKCQARDCSDGKPFTHGKISRLTKAPICDACFDHEEIKLEAAQK